MQHGDALARESGQPSLVEAVVSGDLASLPPRARALCRYALKLTMTPWDMEERDLSPMRQAGLSDRDIVDANQVASYFNYVNRVADGLGVELEDRWPAELRTRRSYPIRALVRSGRLP